MTKFPLPIVLLLALCGLVEAAARADDREAVVVYTALFEKGSAALGAEDGAVVDLLGALARGSEEYRFRLVAHTDPVEEDDGDEKLAEARGAAVRDRLVAAGVDDDEVKVKVRGDERGFGRDDADADRALRRRVEVRLEAEKAEERAVDDAPGDDVEARLQTAVFFDFDRAELRPEFAPTVARIGEMLAGNLVFVARVYGHTDGIGDRAYNERLAARRSQAVVAALAAAGAPAGAVVEAALGERETIGSQAWEATASRALSRSVEIKVFERDRDEP